jgi:hypothetical protein
LIDPKGEPIRGSRGSTIRRRAFQIFGVRRQSLQYRIKPKAFVCFFNPNRGC